MKMFIQRLRKWLFGSYVLDGYEPTHKKKNYVLCSIFPKDSNFAN